MTTDTTPPAIDEYADPRHEILIRTVEDLQATIRKRNETITELRTATSAPPPSLDPLAVLASLQRVIGDGNATRGFHEEGDRLREAIDDNPSPSNFAALRNYYCVKLALISSEVSEALEELRDGRDADEEYTNADPAKAGKPEGVPSEVADVVIRAFDFASEAGFDLGTVILKKLDYNESRERLHGREF